MQDACIWAKRRISESSRIGQRQRHQIIGREPRSESTGHARAFSEMVEMIQSAIYGMKKNGHGILNFSV